MRQITDISQVPDVFFECDDLEFDLSPGMVAIFAASSACPYRAMWRDPDWRARLFDTVSPLPLIQQASARQRGLGDDGGANAPRLAAGAQ